MNNDIKLFEFFITLEQYDNLYKDIISIVKELEDKDDNKK